MDNQELNKESKRKAHFIISISLLSFIFFAAIDLAVRAAWEAPTLDAPAGNKAVVFNQISEYLDPILYSPDVYALIDRQLSISGNVGIGSPSGSLTVNKISNVMGDPLSSGIRVDGGSKELNIGIGGDIGGAYIQTSANDTFVDGESLLLNPFAGNVGIGTTNPTAKLDVNGDLSISGSLISGTVPLSLTTGSLDINTRTTGNLPYSRISGVPPVQNITVSDFASISGISDQEYLDGRVCFLSEVYGAGCRVFVTASGFKLVGSAVSPSFCSAYCLDW